jgi:glycosyltransferase involved in cell wall biosynthesis
LPADWLDASERPPNGAAEPMKILLDHQLPFALAHGGLQIQIERTKSALEALGVEVEWLRWWDADQRGDLIHFFGRANPDHIAFAHAKGMRYVMSELLTGQGSRTRRMLRVQAAVERRLRAFTPSILLASFRWDSYHTADAVTVGTTWEAEVARILFDVPEKLLHIVPNGVEDEFFPDPAQPVDRGNELVCTATITPRKRVVELAEAAVAARVPVRIIGKPYSPQDPYFARFLAIAKAAPELVLYDGPVDVRRTLAGIYQRARGFVLLSTMESRSLSSEEAAAAGCPLLLSDLPWARSVFANNATYCPADAPKDETAARLRSFHDAAPRLGGPPPPCRWEDVARQLQAIYRQVLAHPPARP